MEGGHIYCHLVDIIPIKPTTRSSKTLRGTKSLLTVLVGKYNVLFCSFIAKWVHERPQTKKRTSRTYVGICVMISMFLPNCKNCLLTTGDCGRPHRTINYDHPPSPVRNHGCNSYPGSIIWLRSGVLRVYALIQLACNLL